MPFREVRLSWIQLDTFSGSVEGQISRNGLGGDQCLKRDDLPEADAL
jgi:hypothetical protein